MAIPVRIRVRTSTRKIIGERIYIVFFKGYRINPAFHKMTRASASSHISNNDGVTIWKDVNFLE